MKISARLEQLANLFHNGKFFPTIPCEVYTKTNYNLRVADNWTNAGKILYCGCGPTEVTIVNTLTTHVPGRPVSIGKPTPNNNVYILDENMEPVSFGEIGVMWAGGKGISNGYVGLPELNFKRFTVDKFAKDG